MANTSYEPAGALAPERDSGVQTANYNYEAAGALQPDITVAAGGYIPRFQGGRVGINAGRFGVREA